MNTAIILAAGTGSRMESDIPKQFININNKMVIEYSINAFNQNKNIDQVIVVCNENWTSIIKEKYNNIKVVDGGKNRTESSYIGLLECDPQCINVLIHDASRPFISQSIINNGLNYLQKFDSAIPIIECDDSLINYQTLEYLQRNKTKIIQTPQAFNYKQIVNSYLTIEKNNDINNESLTDNLSVVLKCNENVNVKLFAGEKTNFKITKEEDLIRAKLLI